MKKLYSLCLSVTLLLSVANSVSAKTLTEAMAECQSNLPPNFSETGTVEGNGSAVWKRDTDNRWMCVTFGKGVHAASPPFYYEVSDNAGYYLFDTYSNPINGPVVVSAMKIYGRVYDANFPPPAATDTLFLGFEPYQYFAANEDDICPLDGSSPNDNTICLPQENLTDDQNDAGTPDCGVGNPCNPSTGNKFQVEHDYDGVIKFDRFYNSITRWQAEPALPSGWSHTYSSRLFTKVDIINKRFCNLAGNLCSSFWTLTFKVSNYYLRYDGKLTRLSVATIDRDFPYKQFTNPTESEINALAYTSVYDPKLLKINTAGTYPFNLNRASAAGWEIEGEDGVKEIFDGAGRMTKRIDKNGYVYTLQYNANKLLSVTGESGHKLQFSYDSNGYIASVTTPENTFINFDNRVTGFRFVVDSADSLTMTDGYINSVTYPGGTVRRYHNENVIIGESSVARRLTGITDENGERFATFGYDHFGRAILSEHAGGMEKVTLQYGWNPYDGSADPLTTTVTDGNNTSTYSFNRYAVGTEPNKYSIGTKLVEKNDGGADIAITRDTSGRITERQVFNQELSTNNITRYTYTGSLLTSIVEFYGTPLQRQTLIQYFNNDPAYPSRYETSSVYSAGKKIKQITYNTNNKPTRVLITGYTPSGQVVQRDYQYAYNAYGHLSSVDGPLTGTTDTTLYEYYECNYATECGQLKSVTDALGHKTSFNTYDRAGRLLSWTDQNGAISDNTYDARGRLTTITNRNPGGSSLITQYQFDAVGQLTGIVKGSYQIVFHYSAAHKLLDVADGEGNKITYAYDNGGHKTTESIVDNTGVLKRTIQYTYDYLNKLEFVIRPYNATTNYTYDSAGNISAVNGPLNSESFEYDLRGLMTKKTGGYFGEVTAYAYNKNETLTDVTASNNAHTQYVYDDLGNLLVENSPDSGTTTYTYDAAGNIKTRKTAKNQIFTYTYDVLNRVTLQDGLNLDDDISYTYDTCTNGMGRLCSISKPGGSTVSYAYDVFGNITSHQGVTYSYDLAGRVQTMVYPSGARVTYIYNAAGRVSGVQLLRGTLLRNLATNITHIPFGGVSGLTYGNGLVLNQSYDDDYRLLSQNAGAAMSFNYSQYDANGNLQQRNADTFSYDALDHLESANGIFGGRSYAYDYNGNRTQLINGATTTNYSYATNSNRMTAIGATVVTLDANGNITSQGTRKYNYTPANKLLTAYNGTTLLGSYLYNGLSQRSSKTASSKTTTFNYGLNNELFVETTSGVSREYIYLDGQPLAMLEITSGNLATSKLYYVHSDHLSTPKTITNETGVKVWNATHDPFGNATVTIATLEFNLRFPGQYYDKETGLFYNYFRYYDPSTGRYVTSDPLGVLPGLVPTPHLPKEISDYYQSFTTQQIVAFGVNHTYAYVENNPLKFTDILGLNPGMTGGTTSCAHYDMRCGQSGGASAYYCSIAPAACNLTPPSAWTSCVRQCLQDFDKACGRECDGSPNTQCTVEAHAHCWLKCGEL